MEIDLTLTAAGQGLRQSLDAARRDITPVGLHVERLVEQDGPGAWTFIIDDGGVQPVTSFEADHEVRVVRWDPVTRAGIPDETDLVTPVLSLKKLGTPEVYVPGLGSRDFDGISDHWHVFAHGFHWIACSLTYLGNGLGLALVKFTMDAAGIVTVDRRGMVYSPQSAAGYHGANQTQAIYLTNDLFVTPTVEGIGIGVLHTHAGPFLPGVPADDKAHTMFLIENETPWTADQTSDAMDFGVRRPSDTSKTQYVRRVPLWGDLALSHENGSSCTPVQIGLRTFYMLLATETLSVHAEGSVDLILYDTNWTPLLRKTLVGADPAFPGFYDVNVSMLNTAFIPPPGWLPAAGTSPQWEAPLAMTYKQVHPASARTPGDGLDDHGDIYVVIFPKAFDVTNVPRPPEAYGTVLHLGFGNRPHISFFDDHLLVAWTEFNVPTQQSTNRVTVMKLGYF